VTCDFQATFANGQYRLQCRQCGVVRYAPTAMMVRACKRPRQPRTEAEQAACLAICAACPHWNLVRCQICPCPRTDPAAWRERLRAGQCPAGKW